MRAVQQHGGGAFVDDGADDLAMVEQADVVTCGAMVHVIDRVLEPCGRLGRAKGDARLPCTSCVVFRCIAISCAPFNYR